ncbi:MAG: hypothetical protein M3417_09330 [Actinomycetota bacterium]|nr:hypothetical protein [Actinomycetota bacterium]
MSTAEPSAPSSSSRPAWVSVAVGAAIVVAVVLLFVLLRGGDDDPSPVGSGATGATAARAQPAATTPERLATLARERKRPIYWVGPARGQTYELTETPDGSLYLRYLDAGAKVGDPRPNFLTVGTYPQSDALETVTQASERPGAQVEKLENEGLAVANRSRPNSWYLAYPDSDELVEVFSPRAGRARELVRSGRVVPVRD